MLFRSTDLAVSAFIPDDYLATGEQRMECYKQIAEIVSDDDEKRVRGLMTENYGKLPQSVENLFAIAKLRRLCSRFAIKKAVIDKNGARLVLADVQSLKGDAAALVEATDMFKGEFKLDFSSEPSIALSGDFKEESALYKQIEFLTSAAGIADKTSAKTVLNG